MLGTVGSAKAGQVPRQRQRLLFYSLAVVSRSRLDRSRPDSCATRSPLMEGQWGSQESRRVRRAHLWHHRCRPALLGQARRTAVPVPHHAGENAGRHGVQEDAPNSKPPAPRTWNRETVRTEHSRFRPPTTAWFSATTVTTTTIQEQPDPPPDQGTSQFLELKSGSAFHFGIPGSCEIHSRRRGWQQLKPSH
jgi:hypothetical protein